MAKGHDDWRLCLCDRPDGGCAGLAVRRLSPDRVQALAEEIWAASSGELLPGRPRLDLPDPRSSRAGASARAAYRRRRAQERRSWRPALPRLVLVWGMLGAAPAAGLVVGVTVGAWLVGLVALLVALLAWSQLRFRPSCAVRLWRRQASMQQRTAGLLTPQAEEGYLMLHDVTLPGWLDGLQHLVIGPTGVWVVVSSQRRPTARRHRAVGGQPQWALRELRWKIEALATLLDRGARMPVRGLLCAGRGWACHRSVDNVHVVTSRKLAQVVRQEPPVGPGEVERATTQLLKVLRPAA
jgi:hypothetical protein